MFDQEWWHHTYESSLHIYISVYSSKICSSYPTFWCKELSKKRVTTLTPWFRVSCWALPRPPRPYPASKSSGSWIQRLADVLLRSTFPMIDGSKSFKVTMFRLIAFSALMCSSSKPDLSWNPNFYWKSTDIVVSKFQLSHSLTKSRNPSLSAAFEVPMVLSVARP